MMSGADMKALEEAEKLRKYQDLAIEWLNQFDINAKGKEYPVEILKVFDAAREAKKRKDEEGNTDMLVGSVRTLFGAIKDIGRVSFSAFILPLAMALDRVLPNQVNITPFDFLYITLNSPVGGHGPHSFKFNFTCKLFELNSVELEKDSDILLSCMVDECKKRMTQRGNESAIKLVNFLKSVQKEKFLEAFDIANKASSSGLTHIKEAANSGEIDVYSAILECLNAKLALKNDQFRHYSNAISF